MIIKMIKEFIADKIIKLENEDNEIIVFINLFAYSVMTYFAISFMVFLLLAFAIVFTWLPTVVIIVIIFTIYLYILNKYSER